MEKIFLYDLVNKNWKKIGYNMQHTTILMNITSVVMFVSLMITVVLGVLVLIMEEINTNSIADAFEICGPYYQVIIKMIVTRFSIKKIHELLRQMKREFWAPDKFGFKFESKLIKIRYLVNKSYTIFTYICYFCVTFVMLRPLIFLQSRKYPLRIYNIIDQTNNYKYLSMFGVQISNFIFGVSILLAVDGLFILFITNIYTQLLMLRYAFSTLKLGDINNELEEHICYERIVEYVNHHNMILKFIKDFTNLISFQTFNQFIGDTISLCMGVYIASSESSTDISATLKALTIIMVITTELFLFCTGGTLITEMALDISNAIYSNNWEKSRLTKRISFAISMISMRAQKVEVIKAGNMYQINLNGFAQIMKTSISVYTLMNNVNGKKNNNIPT